MSLLAMSVGWVFTEMGRQPWIVFSLMQTSDAVSPNVSGLDVLISIIAFTLVYGTLAVVEFRLILKAAQKGPEPIEMDMDYPDGPAGTPIVHATVY